MGDPFTLSAIVGGIGTMYAGKKAASAQENAANEQLALLRELTGPGLEAAKFALPRLQELIMEQIAPEAGKPSGLLRTQYERERQGLVQATRRSMAESRKDWQDVGNIGRGRGEQFRIRQAAEEQAGGIGLKYGLAQEAYKKQGIADLTNVLQSLAGLGQSSLGLAGNMTSALGQIGQAKAGFWGDVAGTLTGGLAGWQENRLNEELLDILKAGVPLPQLPAKKD